MQDDRNKVLSENARQTLQRNETLRRLEWGLEGIPPLERSIKGAIFDSERIMPEREKKEVDGNKVLKFKFIYIITDGNASPWENVLYKLTVDSKTSAKIDRYLNEGVHVLDIQILRSPKGIRYKFKPCEIVQSISGFSATLPIRLTNDLYPLQSHI